jgi:hypothetical protein
MSFAFERAARVHHVLANPRGPDYEPRPLETGEVVGKRRAFDSERLRQLSLRPPAAGLEGEEDEPGGK